MNILVSIIKNILIALYQYFNTAVVLTVMFMFIYISASKVGIKALAREWLKNFKENRQFRRVLALAFYASLVLLRTLLSRSYWQGPLQNVIGVWGLYDNNGEIYSENIENVLLIVPLVFFAYLAFEKKIFQRFSFLNVCCKSIIMTFGISLAIEVSQVIFRLGTFQLSDLAYNTLGGLVGGITYYIYRKFKNNND